MSSPSNETALIIVPDIFGRTPALERMARRLSGKYPALVDIIDPYGDRYFRQEDAAYAHFTSIMDIEAYGGMVADRLARENGPVELLGFSAGASAVWHLAGRGPELPVLRATGFYGSQIRQFPDLIPGFRISLIFPASEPHFDVDRLMAGLKGRPNLCCEKASGGHGFMNEYSHHFDPDLYNRYLDRMINPGT